MCVYAYVFVCVCVCSLHVTADVSNELLRQRKNARQVLTLLVE